MKSVRKKETLEEFLSKIEDLNAGVATITANVTKQQSIQSKILAEPSQTERVKQLAAHGELVQENKTVGRRLQKQIKEEQQKLSRLSQQSPAESNIRKTQIQSVAKRFLDVWTEYNTSQVEFREKNKKALLRNIQVQDSNISAEELEEKLDRGDVTILSSILKETSQAKEDLRLLENRHAEMIKLEKGISDIHEMFLDLSNLVAMQGEAVDRIEDGVGAAAAQVEAGREQLGQALRSQKAARKKKIIIAAILAGIALVVILILIFTLL